MQWVASTLHTTSEHGVSSIITADAAHLCCQQSTELTPTGRFKWTPPFRAKDEIWFLRACHHISTGLYCRATEWKDCHAPWCTNTSSSAACNKQNLVDSLRQCTHRPLGKGYRLKGCCTVRRSLGTKLFQNMLHMSTANLNYQRTRVRNSMCSTLQYPYQYLQVLCTVQF